MNICIIGGGQKFGKVISNKLRDDGHSVYIVSHMDHENMEDKHRSCDFSNPLEVVDTFKELTSNLDTIDVLLYNTNGNSGPNEEISFTSDCPDYGCQVSNWNNSLNTGVIIPHLLSVECLKKMNESSKIVFMTTYIARDFNRDNFKNLASYAGMKAAQNHLMIALAEYNDKKSTIFSIEPYLPAHLDKVYKKNVDRIFNELISMDKSRLGKIINVSQ
jgi:NAD(P)-dependent dehydrogenase (short-subunit alcohol dehydrogenase family)